MRPVSKSLVRLKSSARQKVAVSRIVRTLRTFLSMATSFVELFPTPSRNSFPGQPRFSCSSFRSGRRTDIRPDRISDRRRNWFDSSSSTRATTKIHPMLSISIHLNTSLKRVIQIFYSPCQSSTLSESSVSLNKLGETTNSNKERIIAPKPKKSNQTIKNLLNSTKRL